MLDQIRARAENARALIGLGMMPHICAVMLGDIDWLMAKVEELESARDH